MLLVFLFGGLGIYLFQIRPYKEPKTKEKETNVDAALYTEEEQEAVLQGFEKLYQMTFQDASKTVHASIVIPGLRATKTMCSEDEISICTSMTPQGLCVADEFLLISAYCHTSRHHSVIYVLDKYSHKFVKEIVLDGKDHVGGLAYDSKHKNIWVSTNKSGQANVSSFSMQMLKAYNLKTSERAIRYEQEYSLPALKRNSFMTYNEGWLYVGCFSEKEESVVQKYKICEFGGLEITELEQNNDSNADKVSRYVKKLPKQIQGIDIGQNRMFLSKSYGVAKSELMICERKNAETLDGAVIVRITMPQKLQQICLEGKYLYVLFESAAYVYRMQPVPKVDRVLMLNVEKYLGEE